MKIKNMKRTDWRRLLERTYAVRDCVIDGIPGRESILCIHRVTQPLWVQEGRGKVCIADAGHTWVQVALEGQPYWATAMFDGEGRFLQIYFDIARPPKFDDPEDPTFEDLYLDIVLTSQKELEIMDREELDAALACGELTEADHAFALDACEKLRLWLEAHKDEAVDYVTRTYQQMRRDNPPHFAYLVRCADGTLYGGYTTDLAHRMAVHNSGKGAKYTRSRLPVELVYWEAFSTKEAAMSREWQLKHLSRAKKLELVEKFQQK